MFPYAVKAIFKIKYIEAAQLSYMYTRLGYILLSIEQFPGREESLF